jgi:hypothetical protein
MNYEWRAIGTRLTAAALLLSVSFAPAVMAQSAATAPGTRAHVETLAAEKLEGRLAGSAGERLAGDYIVAQLQRIGAKPLPGQKDYRLPFEFTAGTRNGNSSVTLECTGCPARGAAARALSFSDNGAAAGPAVFAGYGLVVPDSQDFGYDSYATLDVKDKVVVVLRYFPEAADPKTKGILARYSDLRYKAMAARQRGARALVVVTGPTSPNAGEFVPMTFDTALAGSGIVAVSVDGSTASDIFKRAGKDLAESQKALDTGNPHVAGFELTNVSINVKAEVIREKRTGHNIAGYLPATVDPRSVMKPWIALGAHYDHLGRGDHGNSLADQADAGRVHHGADDNASGTAAVLAVGEMLARDQRRRHIALMFWSGEELGLIGSAAFAASPPFPLDSLAAYLNFDMVGRMQDNKLTMQATGSSPSWPRVIEQANVLAGFDLLLQQDPYQPTDVATFNQAGIPTLNFFTGTHSDYHKPTDTPDKIQYEDLDRVAAFAAAMLRRVSDAAEPPAFTKVEPQTQGAGRAGIRVFTGTIPDYSTEVKGLLLSGVIAGGPAENAGLQKGDIVVEIAGQTIANIYDYTYALELLRIDEPAKVVYMRDGQRRETTLTPSARR